jgi:hypothetical protein
MYAKLFVPIWSFDEVKALNVLLPSFFFSCGEEDLKSRFHIYGGCVRSILYLDNLEFQIALN